MATLVQKEVLIEIVGSTLAMIARIKYNLSQDAGVPMPEGLTPEETRLCKLKNYLYRTSEADVDYQAIVDEVMPIVEEYKKRYPSEDLFL